MNRFTAADRGAQAIKGSFGRRRASWMTLGGGRRREKEAAGSRQGRWTGPRSAGDGGRDVVEASSRCPSAEEVT